MRRRRGCLFVLGSETPSEESERKDRVRRRFSTKKPTDPRLLARSLPRPSRLLLTRLRRDARAAFSGRASGVSRASEGRATRTPHRHTRSEDTRGCLSLLPRISSPTGARPRVVSSEASKPNNRLGTRRDASRANDRPLEPRLRASRHFRSTRGPPRVDRPIAVLEPSRPLSVPAPG